jgi:hypothetical protein
LSKLRRSLTSSRLAIWQKYSGFWVQETTDVLG